MTDIDKGFIMTPEIERDQLRQSRDEYKQLYEAMKKERNVWRRKYRALDELYKYVQKTIATLSESMMGKEQA